MTVMRNKQKRETERPEEIFLDWEIKNSTHDFGRPTHVLK
jgi:hypothetical protein